MLISSRQHPIVRRCRRLATGDAEPGEVLLDGPHVIEAALAAHVPVQAILTDGRHTSWRSAAARAGVTVYEADERVLEAASPVKTSTGVVAIALWAPAPLNRVLNGAGIVVAPVDVQDPGNVGAVVRSAHALGAEGVLALGATADPAGWKAIRGAMGSTFSVPVGRAPLSEALRLSRERGYRIAATVAAGGDPLDAAAIDGPLLVLLGNEGAGLSSDLRTRADLVVSIPMRPGVESLNVGVTAALVLWEAWRRRPHRP